LCSPGFADNGVEGGLQCCLKHACFRFLSIQRV
jgi:hypothetical protein